MDQRDRLEPRLPTARGPMSEWLLNRLQGIGGPSVPPAVTGGQGLSDDLQLALYLCYESHYSALPGVADDWEWDPTIIGFRRSLETSFQACLSDLVGRCRALGDVRQLIPEIIAGDSSPSISSHMEAVGTLDQMREFLIHRSAYQLKEGDPHTFAVPRLDGRAKQLLVQIQAGEYGADGPDRVMHAELFAQTMRCLGLDERRHAYVDVLPASALMVSNLSSSFALNRGRRGALVGHLAIFEMTSVTAMGRYSRGLARMGASLEARRFYDVHVLADAEHETMALDMAAALATAEPDLVPDILYGARSVLAVEQIFAEQLFSGWRGRTPALVAA